MIIWLGLLLMGICTVIFIIFGNRLHCRRYCQRTFLHSYTLLSLSYIICYLEAMLGISISCFIFYNDSYTPTPLLNFGTIFLIAASSDCFIVRVLREYRIFLLTYIEKGLFEYSKLIERKGRLTEKWNYLVNFSYLFLILSIIIPLMLFRNYITDMNYWEYITYILSSLKILEVVVEFITFIFFMNHNIEKWYRMEALLLIIISFLNTSVIFFYGVKFYLIYSIVTMLKISYVIFNDLFIFCYLLSENERKPILPPICMITTSLFITEIKIVYNVFKEFVQASTNKIWVFLLEFLMEIQMFKFRNSQLLKERLEFYIKKCSSIDEKFSQLIKELELQTFSDQIEEFERFLIDSIDAEAFPTFIKSEFFKKLEEKFKNSRKTYALNSF